MSNELGKIDGIGKAAEKALEFVEKLIAAPLMEGTAILTDKYTIIIIISNFILS